MAECSIARCSQERRIFRKELQKWSKEILYVIGLERLAEELMGARKWRILIQPFTDLESEKPTDWSPEDTCYFCNAKKLPPYDPASGIIPIVDGYNSLRIDTDEHSTSSDQGTAPGSFTSCSSALSPWYASALSSHGVSSSPPPLDQPLDLSINSRRPTEEQRAYPSGKSLQVVSGLAKNVDDDSPRGNSVLKVPQIPMKPGHRKRLDGNSKRSYTEEELQAALRDIQSGKLGTRRAAVIYGIPRSTLRNKVYKLANESKSRAHCRVSNNASSTAVEKDKDENLKLNSANIDVPTFVGANNSKLNSSAASASESLRQLLKHTITQKAQSLAKISENKQNHQDEKLNQFYSSEAMAALQMFGTLEYSQALAPVLSHVFADIQHLALAKCKENHNSPSQSLSALKDDLKLPLLPDLIRRLAEERLEIERDRHKDSESTDQEKLSEETDKAAPLSNVILKVPSYKPAKSPPVNSEPTDPSLPVILSSSSLPGTSSSSHTLSGNKGITVSLKELIARSITQKVNSHLHGKSVSEEPPVKRPHLSSDVNNPSNCTSWETGSNMKNPPKESNSSTNNTNSSNSSDSSKSEKRTRPKRGRYRNYDRDNLARAVRAVQRGEMSVHRAGTFYGVPHSTLEYKVKERHLLRPRKRDTLNSSSVTDTSEAASKPHHHTSAVPNSVSTKVNCKNQKNNVTLSSEQPNGLKTDTEQNHRPSMGSFPSHLSLWQSLPFFSLDFSQLGSNNFFASQMMRKLQENARLHEETQMKRKNQELGILESLIKSTLDRSISPESKTSLLLSAESVPALSEKQSSETAPDK